MSDLYDDDYYDAEIPDGMVVCDKCNGDGTIDCMCCGDFCCCGANDELPCPVCHGEQYITVARWEKRAKAHREIMEALWGKPADAERTGSPSQAQTSTEQTSPSQQQGEKP